MVESVERSAWNHEPMPVFLPRKPVMPNELRRLELAAAVGVAAAAELDGVVGAAASVVVGAAATTALAKVDGATSDDDEDNSSSSSASHSSSSPSSSSDAADAEAVGAGAAEVATMAFTGASDLVVTAATDEVDPTALVDDGAEAGEEAAVRERGLARWTRDRGGTGGHALVRATQ